MKTRTLALLALMTCGLAAGRAGAAEPVTLGAVEVLTGPVSRYGLAIKNGFDLALADINAAGGVLKGRPLAIEYEDSAGNKDQAINAVRKLIGRDKVPMILGPTLSGEMFAIGPVANERHIPILATSNTVNGITEIGPYVFRTSLPEADVVPVTLATAQRKLGIKKVAVLYGNDDAFTKFAYDVMRESLAKLGIETVATESFGAKDTDFSAQLTKIKSLNPDAVVVSALVEAASGILLEARALGFPPEMRFIGGNGFNSPKLGEIAGSAADGTLVGSPWFIAKDDAANKKFVADYRAKYGSDPDQFAAQAFDAVHIVAQALDQAGAAEPEKIKAALATVKYTGVMGPFSFTEMRSPADNSGVVVLEMRDGKFQILP
ncbi:MAG TPA: ABC transporter substrate-binding protein [Aliidongia sp.]|nr:ABC transporter substrate-binding protein [Aliidongia sp.]